MSFHLKSEDEGSHQVCSFMWADNHCVLSQKKNAQQMMKELVEEVERWDMEPKPTSLWWTRTHAMEKKLDMVIKTAGRKYKLPFVDEFRILVNLFSRDGGIQFNLEEKMQSDNRAWWRDAKIFRCKKSFMENQVPKSIRSCIRRLLPRMRELELEPGEDEKSEGMGNEDSEKTIQDEEERRRTDAKLLLEDSPGGKEHLETKHETTIFDGVVCRRNLESDGMVQRRKELRDETLEKVFRWRSTTWWRNWHALNMRLDPGNYTYWKQTWRRHNRGCFWDKIANAWAGEEEWTSRPKKKTEKDKKEFVTFALDRVKHTTIHRQKKEEGKHMKVAEMLPKELASAETSIPQDWGHATILLRGDSYEATQWINGKCPVMNYFFKKEIGDVMGKSLSHYQRELEIRCSMCRGTHNQEADQMANFWVQKRSRITGVR